MSMDIKYRKAFAEVLEVLEHTERTLVRRIPRKIIEFLNQNTDKTHRVVLDGSKKLKDQEISETAKGIIAMLYKNYICQTKELAGIKEDNMDESTEEEVFKILENQNGGENK